MTDIYTDIMNVLDNDAESLELLASFNNAAKQAGISGEQYEEARRIVMLAAIKNNPEAMKMYSDYVYNQINN